MRRVMMFMPLVFVLVVIRFPAGVLVYWITTNTWTIGQQYVVKRRMGPLQAATAGAAAGAGRGIRSARRRLALLIGVREDDRRARAEREGPGRQERGGQERGGQVRHHR